MVVRVTMTPSASSGRSTRGPWFNFHRACDGHDLCYRAAAGDVLRLGVPVSGGTLHVTRWLGATISTFARSVACATDDAPTASLNRRRCDCLNHAVYLDLRHRPPSRRDRAHAPRDRGALFAVRCTRLQSSDSAMGRMGGGGRRHSSRRRLGAGERRACACMGTSTSAPRGLHCRIGPVPASRIVGKLTQAQSEQMTRSCARPSGRWSRARRPRVARECRRFLWRR